MSECAQPSLALASSEAFGAFAPRVMCSAYTSVSTLPAPVGTLVLLALRRFTDSQSPFPGRAGRKRQSEFFAGFVNDFALGLGAGRRFAGL